MLQISHRDTSDGRLPHIAFCIFDSAFSRSCDAVTCLIRANISSEPQLVEPIQNISSSLSSQGTRPIPQMSSELRESNDWCKAEWGLIIKEVSVGIRACVPGWALPGVSVPLRFPSFPQQDEDKLMIQYKRQMKLIFKPADGDWDYALKKNSIDKWARSVMALVLIGIVRNLRF